MTVIQCPNCGRKFNLRKAPTGDFKCPKCFYSSPFSEVLPSIISDVKKNVIITQTGDSDINPNQETKIVMELQHSSSNYNSINIDPNKTIVVQGLQQHYYLNVSFGGTIVRKIDLIKFNDGVYSLGRNSSDSTAQIKISPDINMSRTHAYLKINKSNGSLVVMVQPAKSTNPLIVNGHIIPMGKHTSLSFGDQIKMGQTKIEFSQK